ncbi:hypothetical protein GCM10011410_30410 [Hoyosella rhizosphaerae]|uniref:Uncharacterized protein n=1 Tax=Hoyosella rhizosphaerae TaxID=1755582 RepID=A0A916UJ82_9ACTN|nr:hypothetical protein GCM10011410_30410 [Hoyosella rhizosphaerae]
MRLRREMDHRIALPHKPINKVGVRDVTVDKPNPVCDWIQGLASTRVGQFVQNCHLNVRAFPDSEVHKISADKSSAPGN